MQPTKSPAVCRWASALQPSEIKTNYCNFNKMITTAAFGGYLRTGCPSMIGGYSGPPEGSVVANIATDILQYAVFGTDISACSLFDVRQNTVCCRSGLWAMSMSVQATSRNTHTILDKIINQTARSLHRGYPLHQCRRPDHRLCIRLGTDHRPPEVQAAH